jgi:hypothetical protein
MGVDDGIARSLDASLGELEHAAGFELGQRERDAALFVRPCVSGLRYGWSCD